MITTGDCHSAQVHKAIEHLRIVDPQRFTAFH